MTEQEPGSSLSVSEAVILYTGRGRHAAPVGSREYVLAAAGPDRGEQLADQVEQIFHDANGVPVDWSSCSLPEAGDLVRDAMAARHPELTPEALDAIRWKWTYDWR